MSLLDTLFFRKKLNIILQDEVTECGLACLAMIADYHGKELTLRFLRNRYPVKIDSGLSFFDLSEIANDLGMTARALQFEAHEIVELKTPCILHWGHNHFVVLEKIKGNYVYIADPAIGNRKLHMGQVVPQLSGYALELNPDVRFKKEKKEKGIGLWDYVNTLNGLKDTLILGILAGFVSQLIGLIAPSYVQRMIDDAIGKNNFDVVILLTIIFGTIFLFDVLYSWVIGNVSSYLRNSILQQLSSGVVSHLFRLPITYFLFRNTGDTLSRVRSIGEISGFLINGVLGVYMAVVTMVVTGALMLFYNFEMGLINIGLLVLFALTRIAVQPRLRDAVAQTLNRGAEAEAVLIENIRSAHSIKLLSNESARSNMWANAFTQQLQAVRANDLFMLGFDSLSKAILSIEQLIITSYGAYLVLNGKTTVGTIYAFLQYKNMFGSSFIKIVHLWIERKVLQVHLDRVADIVETETEDPDFSKPIDDVDRLTGAIKVKNLTYAPRGADRDILKDINLEIKPGEKIAIVGRTGSGKTTLLNLISGLYKAPEGKVFADSADLSRVNLRQYRKNLAAVTQSDQLFRGTIMANITNFSPTAKKSLMLEVAKMVQIDKEIEQLDQGYQTNIGDTQKFLSAGQMQRLLIARALYIQPKILILDEFTSNLDKKTALEICKSIMALPCTCIIVTHAEYVLSMVDQIYKMEDGRLEKVGDNYIQEIHALAKVGLEKPQ